MSLLKTLTTDSSIANEKDSVGGSGPLDSGLYNCSVQLAYLKKSEGGALGLVLNLKTDDNREIRQTLWVTSGTAKGCKNYYEDKNGDKQYLPGFLHANSLCLLTVGKEISELETEQKTIKVYSSEAKAEVPTKVDMLTDLLGKEIIVGLIRQTVDKTAKGDDGKYVATGETRDENEIDKLFRMKDKMTTAEIRAGAEAAEFIETWSKKNTGVTKNKAGKGSKDGGVAGAPTAAKTNKPTSSLFG